MLIWQSNTGLLNYHLFERIIVATNVEIFCIRSNIEQSLFVAFLLSRSDLHSTAGNQQATERMRNERILVAAVIDDGDE